MASGLLESWAAGSTGSRGSPLFSGLLADMHAVVAVVEFTVLELAMADAGAGASIAAVALTIAKG